MKRKAAPTAAPRVYAFKGPARIPRSADPQAVGERIESLRLRHGGSLEDEHVVADARDPCSPLHAAFPPEAWDDSTAAHQHRLSLARHLLRSITVVIVTPEEKEISVSAFVATPKPRTQNRSHYTSVEYAMNDEDLRREVLKAALRELLAIRRKYAELSELSMVFAAIDKIRTHVA